MCRYHVVKSWFKTGSKTTSLLNSKATPSLLLFKTKGFCRLVSGFWKGYCVSTSLADVFLFFSFSAVNFLSTSLVSFLSLSMESVSFPKKKNEGTMEKNFK